MARVHEKLGSWVLPKEMEDIGLKNIHSTIHMRETQNEHSFPQLKEVLEHTPEVAEQSVGVEIMLPRR